jgi:hypothetical protein
MHDRPTQQQTCAFAAVRAPRLPGLMSKWNIFGGWQGRQQQQQQQQHIQLGKPPGGVSVEPPPPQQQQQQQQQQQARTPGGHPFSALPTLGSAPVASGPGRPAARAGKGAAASAGGLSGVAARAGRIAVPEDFDWRAYLLRYSDLRNSNIRTRDAAVFHYVDNGYSEQRSYQRVPVLLRYTACQGLFNQMYAHLNALVLADYLGADVVLPPSVYRCAPRAGTRVVGVVHRGPPGGSRCVRATACLVTGGLHRKQMAEMVGREGHWCIEGHQAQPAARSRATVGDTRAAHARRTAERRDSQHHCTRGVPPAHRQHACLMRLVQRLLCTCDNTSSFTQARIPCLQCNHD